MIAQILLLTIISSAISVGFYTACAFDGDEEYDAQTRKRKRAFPRPEAHRVMILWWVRFYGGRIIPHFWTKPLYSCLPCMGSFHSLLPVLVFTGNIWLWPFVALATVGVNKLITVWWR